jgi:ubiquinone biosynthesis accessory factor UbiJ
VNNPTWEFLGDIISRRLETLGACLLRSDPDTLTQLGCLQGKVIALRLSKPGKNIWQWFLLPSSQGIAIHRQHEGAVDVSISGDPWVFFNLLTGEALPGKSNDRHLHISGDVELGQRFQQILRGLDVDWEEHLAQRIGDVPAHQLGNLFRRTRDWSRTSRHTLAQDLREYLQEETKLLAKRSQVDLFLGQVDSLRNDLDRLEQRISRLLTHA